MAVEDGVPDEIDSELGVSGGVPGLFDGQDADEQIEIPGEGNSAGRAGRPDLGGDVLNEARVPVGALSGSHGGGKPAVEAAIIDADDGVRAFRAGQIEHFAEDPAEPPQVSEHVGEADDGELGEVGGEVDPGSGHLRASGADEGWGRGALGKEAGTERNDEFSGEEIAAGFARDEHELPSCHATAESGRSWGTGEERSGSEVRECATRV